MGFEPHRPEAGSPLRSEVVRVNLNAIASSHYGPTAPAGARNGWKWIDSSDLDNIRLRMFIEGQWRVVLERIGVGTTSLALRRYIHEQHGTSDVWVVAHNLGTIGVVAAIYDDANRVVIPDAVEIVDGNVIEVRFAEEQAGRAVVLG